MLMPPSPAALPSMSDAGLQTEYANASGMYTNAINANNADAANAWLNYMNSIGTEIGNRVTAATQTQTPGLSTGVIIAASVILGLLLFAKD